MKLKYRHGGKLSPTDSLLKVLEGYSNREKGSNMKPEDQASLDYISKIMQRMKGDVSSEEYGKNVMAINEAKLESKDDPEGLEKIAASLYRTLKKS
tara:strand:+ start:474 stop:761 length:288 start_codon:yes stop_codon:yes gene_type:complete